MKTLVQIAKEQIRTNRSTANKFYYQNRFYRTKRKYENIAVDRFENGKWIEVNIFPEIKYKSFYNEPNRYYSI